ncbi:MAG: IS1380 family transposase [Geobacteraceae bacterium]|nr:MAG: IS1380 family transposase [Geobacteraceae bacterium]
MSQQLLNFQYEQEKKERSLTSFAGIGPYFDLFKILKLSSLLNKKIGVSQGEQGYRDSEIGISLILINLVGGDCVEDVERLEADEGLKKFFQKLTGEGFRYKSRFRRGTHRGFPSQSAIFRYLEQFDNGSDGKKGKAVIPDSIDKHKVFLSFNKTLAEILYRYMGTPVATLDQDATLIETAKKEALHSYKGFKAYQPLNTFWSELGLVLHTEFRPGNVPADFELQRSLKEAMGALPAQVSVVRYRADGASYNHDLLKYLDEEPKKGSDEVKKRFGRVIFCVSAPITDAFKRAVLTEKGLEWKPLDLDRFGNAEEKGREWAEVCYVPNKICTSKKGREYRYFVTRQRLQERTLPGMDASQVLPFPVMEMNRTQYKVFSVVTNSEKDGAELIRWHDQRCGRSEEVHAILKNDLAGGCMPSRKFGANAAWWWFSILTHNLQTLFKRVSLGKDWWHRRMKAIRLYLINLPGRTVLKKNVLTLKLAVDGEKLAWINSIRDKIAEFARGPCLA